MQDIIKKMRSRLLLKDQPQFNKLLAGGFALVLIAVGIFAVFFSRAATVTNTAPAKSADSFVQSVGVNTHLNFTNTVYYNNYPALRQALRDLGVSYIRDSGVGDQQAETVKARLKDLAGYGIKPFVIAGNPTNSAAQRQATINHLADLKAAGALAGVEGANEWDLNGSSNWISEVKAYTQDLWNRVQANPTLKGSPVLGPTFHYRHADDVGDLSAYMTHGNVHAYPSAKPPTDHQQFLGYELDRYPRYVSGGKTTLLTEWGYHNSLKASVPTNGHRASSERAAAVYGPRQAIYNFASGIPNSFSYELIDLRPDAENNDVEHNFGLLRNDFSRKPVFTALANMTSLLKDPGPAFTPTVLNYKLDGADDKTRTMLLQKRDGSHWLAVWQETSVWDRDAYRDLDPANVQPVLTLPQPVATIQTFMPNRGTAALRRLTNASSLSFESSEEVTLIEIKGAAAASPPPPPPPPPDTTPPSTPASLRPASQSDNAIALAWNAATDNVGVTGYKIFRGGTQIGTTASTAYTSSGLSPNTAYSYTVLAYDAAGNNSAQSAAVTAKTTTTVASTPPPPPPARVPVCSYWNAKVTNYYYTPGCAASYGDYQKTGIAWYAYTTQAPGTVPVCGYYNAKLTDHAYTTDCAASYGDYQKFGIVWYAYSTQATGTVPVCGYYNSKMTDHAYTRGCAASYGDWDKYGNVFYAYTEQ